MNFLGFFFPAFFSSSLSNLCSDIVFICLQGSVYWWSHFYTRIVSSFYFNIFSPNWHQITYFSPYWLTGYKRPNYLLTYFSLYWLTGQKTPNYLLTFPHTGCKAPNYLLTFRHTGCKAPNYLLTFPHFCLVSRRTTWPPSFSPLFPQQRAAQPVWTCFFKSWTH